MIIRAIVIGTLFIVFNLSAVTVVVPGEGTLRPCLTAASLSHFESLVGILANKNIEAREVGCHINLVVTTYYLTVHGREASMEMDRKRCADREKLVEIFLPGNPDAQAEAKDIFITYRGTK